jgi:hypothetical protein
MVWGLVVHLVCDWLLQNEYLAKGKVSLCHPAAWIHSGVHLVGLLLVFWVPVAICIAITHLLIDTRRPLQWWRKVFGQTTEGPMAVHVAVWSDQVAHVAVIAAASLLQRGAR